MATGKISGGEGFDVAVPIHNAYVYTDKTEEAASHKEEKPDIINQVLDFLKAHYDIRRNVILDRLEYLNFDEKEEGWKGRFRPMRARSYNSIFLALQLAGIKCFRNYLQAVIDSTYARDFNPFTDYVEKLEPWMGRLIISAGWRIRYRRKTRSSGRKVSEGGSWECWHVHCRMSRSTIL